MNEAAVLDKLANSGVDAVVTVVLLDKNKEQLLCSRPGLLFTIFTIYQRNFWGYYTTIYESGLHSWILPG
jgi:hypothetical protein